MPQPISMTVRLARKEVSMLRTSSALGMYVKMSLKNTLRYLKGEELITHLGREYYD